MKKLTMLAATMALMMVLAAAPAVAQPFFFNPNFNPNFDNGFFNPNFDNGFFNPNFDNGFFANGNPSISQDVEPVSGNVSLNNSVSNTGNYASQCTPAQQTGNSGNFTNAPAVLQLGGRSGGIEPEGIEVNFGGSVTADCPSTIEQSSAASG